MDPSTYWEDTLAPKLYPKCIPSTYLNSIGILDFKIFNLLRVFLQEFINMYS